MKSPHALLVAAIAAASIIAFQPAVAADEPSVTPYRPSVSTPAALSAPGWLEIEAGVLRARGDGSTRRDSIPYTLKLAFSDDWGLRIGGDGWVRQRDEDGNLISGGGDTSVVLKRRFSIDKEAAFGLEAGATIPTAKSGLGSGKSDYSINGIFSADIADYHTDLNVVTTRVGQAVPGVSRTQYLWAASLSRALTEQWGVVGEFSGTHQSGTERTAQFLAAVSYNVSPALTLDAGLSRRLTSAGPRWTGFAGLTFLAAKIF